MISIDLETTGKDKKEARIVQIGIAGHVTVNQLVNPGMKITGNWWTLTDSLPKMKRGTWCLCLGNTETRRRRSIKTILLGCSKETLIPKRYAAK